MSAIPLPSNYDDDDEIRVTTYRILQSFTKSFGDMINQLMTDNHGRNWEESFIFPNPIKNRSRICKYRDLWDITAIANELSGEISSPFRGCLSHISTNNRALIYKAIWNIKKFRDEFYHTSEKSQVTILNGLLEEIRALKRITDIYLEFKPEEFINRVNELVNGVKYSSAPNEFTKEEFTAYENTLQEYKKDNVNLKNEISTLNNNLANLRGELANVRKNKTVDEELNKKYNKALYDYTELKGATENTFGRISSIESLMGTVFKITDVDSLLFTFTLLQNGESDKSIGDTIDKKDFETEYRLRLPVTEKVIQMRSDQHEIVFTGASESDVYTIWRALKPEGGTIFVDPDMNCYTLVPTKDRIEDSTCIFLGNITNICVIN